MEGTWSASLEWLVSRLARRFPTLAFSEVRYRVKSWRSLDWCEEDARAAVVETGAARTLLLGFSMGGAVAVQSADAGVEGVLGLAPWLPDRIRLNRLRGKRLDVVHGTLDGWFPGVPGVRPSSSREGFERARRLGVEEATGSSGAPCTASRCAPRSASSRSPGPGAGPPSPRSASRRGLRRDRARRRREHPRRHGPTPHEPHQPGRDADRGRRPAARDRLRRGLLWGVAFHWVDVAILVGFYVVCAFGTTIGFHRYFTHKGFEARTPVKGALAVLGCMTMQGP